MSHRLGPIDEPTAEALRALGEILLRVRGARGLSQRALAGRCGLSQSAISRLENGLAPGVRIAWVARLLAGLDQGVPPIGHEPWNGWTTPGWVLLIERFSERGRLAARLALESERVLERPKGGQPYRRRPPIRNPSDAYLEAVEHQRSIAKFERLKLEAERKAEIAAARLREGLEAELIVAEADELE
jgi:transcriptional regulator with XRE-family HTH domain